MTTLYKDDTWICMCAKGVCSVYDMSMMYVLTSTVQKNEEKKCYNKKKKRKVNE